MFYSSLKAWTCIILQYYDLSWKMVLSFIANISRTIYRPSKFVIVPGLFTHAVCDPWNTRSPQTFFRVPLAFRHFHNLLHPVTASTVCVAVIYENVLKATKCTNCDGPFKGSVPRNYFIDHRNPFLNHVIVQTLWALLMRTWERDPKDISKGSFTLQRSNSMSAPRAHAYFKCINKGGWAGIIAVEAQEEASGWIVSSPMSAQMLHLHLGLLFCLETPATV